MAYTDPNTVHNPATGTVAPAAWGDVLRDDLEFLIDPPACSVFNSSAQSVGSGSFTALTAGNENYDNDSMHSTVTNTSRITAQTSGRYFVSGLAQFANNATNDRVLGFSKNGGTTIQSMAIGAAGGSVNTVLSASITFVLTAGDYIELIVWHNLGSNLNVTLLEFIALYMTR